MTKIQQLNELKQSVWLDYIRRAFVQSGDLQALVNEGLRGLTSNPTIFEKAISGSADYDEELSHLTDQGKAVEEIYQKLILKDIADAADIFRPLYDQTDGSDGFVSLEVSPRLAYDTEKTIEEAKQLYSKLNRPNIMIKVPATQEGLPAIAELVATGINVNATLIFAVENYLQVGEAFLQGLEKLAIKGSSVAGGHSVERVASVASFFISRIDAAVDGILEQKGNHDLQGKVAVANARLAYEFFQKIFSGSRWDTLADLGARKQRLLWASTGTKNPSYPDTLYVDELIGPDTVNTVPLPTYYAFKKQGKVDVTLTKDLDDAKEQLSLISALEINLDEITDELQRDGVKSFAASFDALMESIKEKRNLLSSGKKYFRFNMGKFRESVQKTIKQLKKERIIHRIWENDYTVWKNDPGEISNRLGWLNSPDEMSGTIGEITEYVDSVKRDGFTDALLLGMGGSSLAPEVFRKTFGKKEGYIDLHVLDSTDPAAVLEYARELDPAHTLYIVSTKSGGTIETLSFMKYFYNLLLNKNKIKEPGKQFTAITDPGSELEKLAVELKFRKIFRNNPDIGGRYSALSYFGLVPAALCGIKLQKLLDRAATMICNCDGCNCPIDGDNSGAILGAIMGELAVLGRNKVTFLTSPRISSFGAWVEQLIAESTGKEGKGIVPVDGEALLLPANYANDRLFIYMKVEDDPGIDSQIRALSEVGYPIVYITLKDTYDLGGEFFRWEMATAVAGWRLGINPFDQPNVESAKVRAKEMVNHFQKSGQLPGLSPIAQMEGIKIFADVTGKNANEVIRNFLDQAWTGENESTGRSYIALQAFVKPNPDTDKALHSLRTKIQKKYRMATTVGYGPRFLHSTGQLHKGDEGHGIFIQVIADISEDAPIPEKTGKDRSSISFGVLKSAQSLGDRQALLDGKRKVITLHLTDCIVRDLKNIEELI